MLIIHLVLLLICLAAIWILFNDEDEVHNIAAIFAGLIALVWSFILTPLPIQMLITGILLIICRKIYAPNQKS